MGETKPVYDLTLFGDDDATPIWGSATSGRVITESSFQTNDPDMSHSRPYLRAPRDFSGPEVDFASGSSKSGTVTAQVLDKRRTETVQTTGIVTQQIESAIGNRAVLRRWIPETSSWKVLVDGVAHDYTVDRDELVIYNVQIRDGREFERAGSLFSSNHVLWGEDGGEGSPINYGSYSAFNAVFDAINTLFGTDIDDLHLVPKTGPFESVGLERGSVNHFIRRNDPTPSDGIYWGVSTVVNSDDEALDLGELGVPTQREDGLWYYEGFRIRWRAKGSGDDWTVLSEMPRATNRRATEDPFSAEVLDSNGDPLTRTSLYFGTTDPAELPATDQEIEFQVLAEEITEDTPFWWDGGTLGDLLQEIVDGDHTSQAPRESYDSSAVTSFRTNTPTARFFLTEPVNNRRRWVEENIYQPAFAAPTFDDQQAVKPRFWRVTQDDVSATVLDADTVRPVGDWRHGIGNAIGRVEITYLREILESEEDAKERLGIEDPAGTRTIARWKRLVTEERTISQDASDPVTGAKTLKLEPVTIRSISGSSIVGKITDVVDDVGRRIARRAAEWILPRWQRGAPRYIATATATPANLALELGETVRLRAEWLPEYKTGLRGARRYMQIYSISERDPSTLEIRLEDVGIPDPEGDEDIVDPSGVDCLTGGTKEVAPTGKAMRYFESDGTLENVCSDPVTVRLLAIAGGGGGNPGESPRKVGGGGGAGGVLDVEEVTINPGESVPVRVGTGASAGDRNDGEDSILWVDSSGDALSPGSDSPDDAQRAHGGGGGSSGDGVSGSDGGSGGGGGALSASTDGGTGGGTVAGASDQGNPGGDGVGAGGLATEFKGAGGGGGSFNNPGVDGEVVGDTVTPGAGGGSKDLPDWGVTAGGGGGGGGYKEDGATGAVEVQSTGDAGTGLGAGGGGGSAGVGGTAGKDGFIAVQYAADRVELSEPVKSSETTTSENQREICITEADWPTVVPSGYRVHVEYAFGGSSEPAADSGEWTTAGYIEEAGGCVKTEPIPVGSKLWTRLTAEADDFVPSATTTPEEATISEEPGLYNVEITVDADTGVPTVTWKENPFTDQVQVRAERHDEDATLASTLTLIATVDASDRSYELSGLALADQDYITVDLVAQSEDGITEDSSGKVGQYIAGDADDPFDTADWQEYSDMDGLTLGGSGELRANENQDSDAGPVRNEDLAARLEAMLQARLTNETGAFAGLSLYVPSNPDDGTELAAQVEFGGSDRFIVKDQDSGQHIDQSPYTVAAKTPDTFVWLSLWSDGENVKAYDFDSGTLADGSFSPAHSSDRMGVRLAKEGLARWMNWYAHAGHTISVTGLGAGTGRKAQLRDSGDALLEEATEVSGVASLECIDVQMTDVAKLEVRASDDTLLATITTDGINWGGSSFTFEAVQGADQTFRASKRFELPDVRTRDEAGDSLDKMVFDDDLNLTLDDDLGVVRDDT